MLDKVLAAQSAGNKFCGFLSLHESKTAARPLYAWSPQQRAKLCERLSNLHCDWLIAWSGENQTGKPSGCVELRESYDGENFEREEVLLLHVCHLLFVHNGLSDSPECVKGLSNSPISLDVAKDAMHDWLSRLHEALGRTKNSREKPEPYHQDPSLRRSSWDGYLFAVFPFRDSSWVLCLSPEEVLHILGNSDDLDSIGSREMPDQRIPLDHALTHLEIGIQVELEPLDLTIGQLQSLDLGDVVVLSHPLDAPALVKIIATDVVNPADVPQVLDGCQAWLGKSGQRLAVELHLSVS